MEKIPHSILKIIIPKTRLMITMSATITMMKRRRTPEAIIFIMIRVLQAIHPTTVPVMLVIMISRGRIQGIPSPIFEKITIISKHQRNPPALRKLKASIRLSRERCQFILPMMTTGTNLLWARESNPSNTMVAKRLKAGGDIVVVTIDLNLLFSRQYQAV
jgi:hypothetical protein